MSGLLGADQSVYQGETSVAGWQALKDAGYTVACVGCWHGTGSPNPYCRQSLLNAESVGLIPAIYIALDGGLAGDAHVDSGYSFVGSDLWNRLAFVAVDVELPSVTAVIVRSAVTRVWTLGKRAPIYTGGWFWGFWWQREGRPDFTDCEQWLADYDWVEALDSALQPGLGMLVIKQFRGTFQVAGATIDGNVIDETWIRQEEIMTPAQEAKLDKAVALADWFDSKITLPAPDGRTMMIKDFLIAHTIAFDAARIVWLAGKA